MTQHLWCTGCGKTFGITMAEAERHADCVDPEVDDTTPPPMSRAHETSPYRAPLPGIDPGEQHAARLLDAIVHHGNVDPETPHRFLKGLRDFTTGYRENIGAILKTFPLDVETRDPGIVAVRGIPFASLCEHHVLPFTGTVDVAYLPNDRIVGLSKIPRLVRAVTRRLQVQERIGSMVADALQMHVSARGVMVIIRSRHSCMALRGVESPGEMVTSTARGVFLTNDAARAEVMALLR
jgi:GTP cyclohydrolase I